MKPIVQTPIRLTLSLFVLLATTWLLLSGFYTALLLSLGGFSCLLVVVLCRRMAIVDPEGHPNHLFLGLVVYIPWLLWEIFKANIDIARRIVQPDLPIAPCVIRVKASQKTHLGQVIYANSITLTPGTISVDLGPNVIRVHALHQESADGVLEGEMDARVSAVEGQS